jgi:hypothetical protein
VACCEGFSFPLNGEIPAMVGNVGALVFVGGRMEKS